MRGGYKEGRRREERKKRFVKIAIFKQKQY